MTNTNKMKLVFGDVTLGIHGENFSYIFSYQTGGMESLVLDGVEWLYRSPRPAFWRACTSNDRGCGFHLKSGMWLAADQFISCIGIKIAVDEIEIPWPVAPENNRFTGQEKAEKVRIVYRYQTITVPKAEVDITYEVKADGSILVTASYYGKSGLPELPVFGVRFLLPTVAEGYRYQGLSGETYPDRKAGGKEGIYQIEGLPVTPYLKPQDCNMHMDTDWLEIYRNTNTTCKEEPYGILFNSKDCKFAFSCIPYTPEELESALHQEELPLPRRTVVTILGAVRGVGGIDSWGADVEEAYHVKGDEEITFSFEIKRA